MTGVYYCETAHKASAKHPFTGVTQRHLDLKKVMQICMLIREKLPRSWEEKREAAGISEPQLGGSQSFCLAQQTE